MNSTHFDPHYNKQDDTPERTPCGIYTPEYDYSTYSCFNYVTCKRCLKMKNKLITQHQEQEKDIIDQMESFNNFLNNQAD